MDRERFEPDSDASDLDRALFVIAKDMDGAGWAEDAEGLLSSMAALRETWRAPGQPDLKHVVEQLETIMSAAESARDTIIRVYPDPFAIG
ncbi:MAG TPA: hypothetical protein VFW65_32000 [Pseudonocardiaceae bacterium]|nr:hypothetical protein [Pseudonocardiaceae bacterium]